VGAATTFFAAVGDPPGLYPARMQMAFSLGAHIVLACFGVAFPAMIWVVHRRGLQGDDVALGLAKRWSKVAAVLFAVGAVSGTILSFEMGLLWPGLMREYGDVIGLPFAFEGLAFFTEAIFLGAYLYGWNRLPPRVHLATLVPIAVSGIVGTFCILSVNAWMNSPSGFRLVDDGAAGSRVVDVDPWAAMFNEAVWLQFVHMLLAAYMVVGFVVAAVYAFGMLRGRHDAHHRLGFVVPFAFASIAALLQPVTGHLLGQFLVDHQPEKLAAMELSLESERDAPLVLGGVLVDGKVVGGIRIPKVASFLAGNSFDTVVPGIEDVPPDERPPANAVHLSFQAMVAIGSALVLLVGWYWWARRRGDPYANVWLLRASVAAGVASVVALELGWMTTELGRQPWIVYRVLRVRDAASDVAGGLWVSFAVMLVVYVGMFVGAALVLRSMAQRWRGGESLDLPTPYGPSGSAT
jgi:cytochrome d ubiquinol oxidase subunit I